MSYGNFSTQIESRGAKSIKRSKAASSTTFELAGTMWQCSFKNQPAMTNDLADGCEMTYCLNTYCEKSVAPAPNDSTDPSDSDDSDDLDSI